MSNSDWWYLAVKVTSESQARIARWVLEQEWPHHTVFKKPSDYHVTLVYSYDGRNREDTPRRAVEALPFWGLVGGASEPRIMTPGDPRPGALVPVAIPLDSVDLHDSMVDEQEIFRMARYKVSMFDEVLPHVTVAVVPESTDPALVEGMSRPDFHVELEDYAYVGGLQL
jgi:hypothetical protein